MTQRNLEPGEVEVRVEPRRVTLKEHGRRTVVAPFRDLAFEPMDIAFRAKVGKLVDGDPYLKDRLGLRVLHYAAHALTRVGEDDFAAMPIAKRVVEVGKMRLQDVIAMSYMRAAEEDEGHVEAELGGSCPHCGAELPRQVRVDVMGLGLWVWEDVPKLRYRLRRPWKCLGQDVTEVTMEPPRLGPAVEKLSQGDFDNPIMSDLAWTAAAITAVNGTPLVLTPAQLTQRDPARGVGLSSGDFTAMRRAVDRVLLGAESVIGWRHEACGQDVPIILDWGQTFFGRSGA